MTFSQRTNFEFAFQNFFYGTALKYSSNLRLLFGHLAMLQFFMKRSTIVSFLVQVFNLATFTERGHREYIQIIHS